MRQPTNDFGGHTGDPKGNERGLLTRNTFLRKSEKDFKTAGLKTTRKTVTLFYGSAATIFLHEIEPRIIVLRRKNTILARTYLVNTRILEVQAGMIG